MTQEAILGGTTWDRRDDRVAALPALKCSTPPKSSIPARAVVGEAGLEQRRRLQGHLGPEVEVAVRRRAGRVVRNTAGRSSGIKSHRFAQDVRSQ